MLSKGKKKTQLGLSHLLRTPPSSDALRHSGGASLLCTSATVTLYLDVELSSERRPGTEQKMSAGVGISSPLAAAAAAAAAASSSRFLDRTPVYVWERRCRQILS